MRVAQYKILTVLLEKIQVPDYIHAFEKGRNIPEMATMHVGKQVVVSIDLKDYFTSIKQYHLEQVFEHLGFESKPARLLSELCTYKSHVPQGALTSPKISNVVTMFTFGPLIKQYCDERGFTMSIYADDITISSDTLLSQEGSDTVTSLIQYIKESVAKFGFRLNNSKTKVMRYYQRQYVCGAVVNNKVNLIKSERYKLRALVHNCEVNGIEVEAAKNDLTSDEFISRTNGRLNWFRQLNPEAGTRIINLFMKTYGHESPNGCNSHDERVEIQGTLDVNQVIIEPNAVGTVGQLSVAEQTQTESR